MKEKLRQLIAKGRTEKALQLLLEITQKRKDNGLQEEVILLSANYEQYTKDKRLEISKSEDQKISITRINRALLHLILQLPDEWLEENFPAPQRSEVPLGEEKEKLRDGPSHIGGNYQASDEGEQFMIKCSKIMNELKDFFDRDGVLPSTCDRAEGMVESLINEIPDDLRSNDPHRKRRLLPGLLSLIRKYRPMCSLDSPESETTQDEILLQIEVLLEK